MRSLQIVRHLARRSGRARRGAPGGPARWRWSCRRAGTRWGSGSASHSGRSRSVRRPPGCAPPRPDRRRRRGRRPPGWSGRGGRWGAAQPAGGPGCTPSRMQVSTSCSGRRRAACGRAPRCPRPRQIGRGARARSRRRSSRAPPPATSGGARPGRSRRIAEGFAQQSAATPVDPGFGVVGRRPADFAAAPQGDLAGGVLGHFPPGDAALPLGRPQPSPGDQAAQVGVAGRSVASSTIVVPSSTVIWLPMMNARRRLDPQLRHRATWAPGRPYTPSRSVSASAAGPARPRGAPGPQARTPPSRKE